MQPGWYSFNYAVYFPTTHTYAWINHREYGFPVNVIKPETAYLSHSPPPLDSTDRRKCIAPRIVRLMDTGSLTN